MALFKFTKAILEGRAIDVYNHGDMERDFTYVDDVVEGIVRLLPKVPQPDPDWVGTAPADPVESSAPFRVFNIGNHTPVQLMDMIAMVERCLGEEAEKNLMPMQPGDVRSTSADVDGLLKTVGWQPSTKLEDGIARFVEWYRGYYNA
jgi:UDP-glucuronate 4-epimerase